MAIYANTLPPDVQVGDIIQVAKDTGDLEKGKSYYVVDIDTKEVVALGGEKLPEGLLVLSDVETDLVSGKNSNPVSQGAVKDALDELSPTNHTHNINELEGTLPLGKGGTGATTAASARASIGLGSLATKDEGEISHASLTDKDAANIHPISAITGLAEALSEKANKFSNLSDLTNKATARTALGLGTAATKNEGDFATDGHNHALDNVNDFTGVLPINKGGTGASTAAQARTNLGLGDLATRNLSSLSFAASNHNHSITDLSGTLTLARGGTGATTAAAARTALGLGDLATRNLSSLGFAASNHTHTINNLTGTLALNRGGTGATTQTAARSALGLGDLATKSLSDLNFASSSHNHSIGSLTGTLALNRGGTGATTAAQARTNLGLNNLGALAYLSEEQLNIYSASEENGTPAVATGSYGLALGYSAEATQSYSFAAGYMAESSGVRAVALGYSARASGIDSTAMGKSAVASGIGSLALGHIASAGGDDSIAIGYNTGTPAPNSIAIGLSAKVLSTHDYSVALGSYTATNAAKQIQIGAASGASMPSTVHTAVAITTRSDERDKTDIRDTELGLEFINKLRPVQWRWDYRGDYLPEEPEDFHEWSPQQQDAWTKKNNIQNVKPTDKDGSKKRTRFHNGFIAQEVKAVMDELGVDFAGYQDASIQGCSDGDVRGLVYEQFLAPMVKAVQEQQAMIEAQQATADRQDADIAELRSMLQGR